LIFTELKEKVPAPKQAWQALMRRAVPKAEDSAIPTAHEHIPAPAPRQDHGADAVQLQVVG